MVVATDFLIVDKIKKKIIKKLAKKLYTVLILISEYLIFDITFSTINFFTFNFFETFNNF